MVEAERDSEPALFFLCATEPGKHLMMFYETVQRLPECTVAQAAAEARRFLRQSHPHDPAWLAYSVYAHPNARVVLG